LTPQTASTWSTQKVASACCLLSDWGRCPLAVSAAATNAPQALPPAMVLPPSETIGSIVGRFAFGRRRTTRASIKGDGRLRAQAPKKIAEKTRVCSGAGRSSGAPRRISSASSRMVACLPRQTPAPVGECRLRQIHIVSTTFSFFFSREHEARANPANPGKRERRQTPRLRPGRRAAHFSSGTGARGSAGACRLLPPRSCSIRRWRLRLLQLHHCRAAARHRPGPLVPLHSDALLRRALPLRRHG
jgi:hypothetical protein